MNMDRNNEDLVVRNILRQVDISFKISFETKKWNKSIFISCWHCNKLNYFTRIIFQMSSIFHKMIFGFRNIIRLYLNRKFIENLKNFITSLLQDIFKIIFGVSVFNFFIFFHHLQNYFLLLGRLHKLNDIITSNNYTSWWISNNG